MFWLIPVPLHKPWINLDANLGSLSLMNFQGSPKRRKMCCTISPTISSAVAASLHGINSATLLQSWLVTVSIKSYPCDFGSLVIKSKVTVSNGIALGWGNMGCSGTLVGHMLILCLWHSAHPLTYLVTSLFMFGHQYCLLSSWFILLIPGCLYTGESW